jgi:hypothetical protein
LTTPAVGRGPRSPIVDPLDSFVAFVSRHLGGVKSIEDFAPRLCALGQTGFLEAWLRRPESTRPTNDYLQPELIVLARETRPVGFWFEEVVFEVRATLWPAYPWSPLYADTHAHTHPFDLLTYGYQGPGYWTVCYDVDPTELARTAIGASVTLGVPQYRQLATGSTLYYPAYTVAHRQHPPEMLSISLNLRVPRRTPLGFPQYYVDPVTMTRQADEGRRR